MNIILAMSMELSLHREFIRSYDGNKVKKK